MATKETIAISKFKATCLAVLKRVKRTGRPIVVTKFGEPIAEIVPPTGHPPEAEWLGCLQGSVRFTGDVVEPVAASEEWDALS